MKKKKKQGTVRFRDNLSTLNCCQVSSQPTFHPAFHLHQLRHYPASRTTRTVDSPVPLWAETETVSFVTGL